MISICVLSQWDIVGYLSKNRQTNKQTNKKLPLHNTFITCVRHRWCKPYLRSKKLSWGDSLYGRYLKNISEKCDIYAPYLAVGFFFRYLIVTYKLWYKLLIYLSKDFHLSVLENDGIYISFFLVKDTDVAKYRTFILQAFDHSGLLQVN